MDLSRKFVARLARHNSIVSRGGASGKQGAVRYKTDRRPIRERGTYDRHRLEIVLDAELVLCVLLS